MFVLLWGFGVVQLYALRTVLEKQDELHARANRKELDRAMPCPVSW